MTSSLKPFNIDILVLDNENSKLLKPITALDIFDGATKNFHPAGLFSTEIFYKYGEERRNRAFGYVDIKVPVFHPVIAKALSDLKELYGEIMAGTGYAVWDLKTKDFIRSTPADGRTGMTFFLQHFKDIVYENRPSIKREYNIKLIQLLKERCMMDKVLVLPAGLRDFEVDAQGKPSEDEINTFYRKFISYANLITDASIKVNPESIDQLRYSIAANFADLYNYIKDMLEGKKKLILGKYASRKVFNGTRNVITSINITIDDLDSPGMISTNQTVVGLYQYLKATLPVSIYQIKDYCLHLIFTDANGRAKLIDKKTLLPEVVDIKPMYYDDWMSDEGLEKTITLFSEEHVRHNYLEIEGRYMMLIYKGPDGTFKLLQSIEDLPEGRDPKHVSPMTFTELLYLSVCKYSNGYPNITSRYPIAGFGSVYPSFTYLKPTIDSEVRTELGDDWMPTSNVVYNFPVYGSGFVNSMSPSPTHIKALKADFDGDSIK